MDELFLDGSNSIYSSDLFEHENASETVRNGGREKDEWQFRTKPGSTWSIQTNWHPKIQSSF